MLSQRDIVYYLLESRLIGPESVVEGDVRVADASRRNQNFKVLRERAPNYLLKQGVGHEGAQSVAHEASVYERLHSLNGLGRYLPAWYGYEPKHGLLIIELVRDGGDLREYHARSGRFSKTLAAALGKALGSVHRLTAEQGKRAADEHFAHQAPSVLSIHRPELRILRGLSNANVELIKIVQRHEGFARALNELREEWRAAALIHGDLKWDNCVVFAASAASRRQTRLKLVDWELAGWGDPCFDVGSVFTDYLSFWIASIPITGEHPPERWTELARFPLERMQPAVGSFWRAYVSEMELPPKVARDWLPRAVRYAAARLIQTGFEQAQQAVYLTSNIICSLQLSLNMLMRPTEAATHLLGVLPEEAA